MADLRKQLASAITGSNLAASDITETALDKIMAFGASGIKDPLGCALWRLKWCNDATEYKPALMLLRKRMGASDTKNRTAGLICERVLCEWLNEVCTDCNGRGKLVVEGTPHVLHECVKCAGRGILPASEQERVAATGIPHKAYPKWEKRFTDVRALIEATDTATYNAVMQLLGRYGRKNVNLQKYIPKGVASIGR